MKLFCRADLARLAIIKQHRAEAAARREQEKKGRARISDQYLITTNFSFYFVWQRKKRKRKLANDSALSSRLTHLLTLKFDLTPKRYQLITVLCFFFFNFQENRLITESINRNDATHGLIV